MAERTSKQDKWTATMDNVSVADGMESRMKLMNTPKDNKDVIE